MALRTCGLITYLHSYLLESSQNHTLLILPERKLNMIYKGCDERDRDYPVQMVEFEDSEDEFWQE